MNYYYVIGSLIIFFILLFIKVNFVLEYMLNKNTNRASISFYVFSKSIGYTYDMPLEVTFDGIIANIYGKVGKKEKAFKKEKDATSFYEIKYRFRKYKNTVEYIKKHVTVDELELKITAGVEDAAHTAVLCGGLWSLAGILTSMLENNIKISKKNIRVTPCYNKTVFNIRFFCIIKLRVVNIIQIRGFFILQSIAEKIKSRRWYKWLIPLKG